MKTLAMILSVMLLTSCASYTDGVYDGIDHSNAAHEYLKYDKYTSATRKYTCDTYKGSDYLNIIKTYSKAGMCEKSKEITKQKQGVTDKVTVWLNNNKVKNAHKNKLYASDMMTFIGMPEELMLIALGNPQTTNTTTTSFSLNKQFVYRGYYLYVYTQNGIVIATQD